MLPQIRLEVMAIDQAHCKEQSAVVWSLPNLIHREDVRVIYRCRRACLAAKARAPLRVCAQIGRNHLECDTPVQGELASLVEFPHAAAGAQTLDTEACEDLSRLQIRHSSQHSRVPFRR